MRITFVPADERFWADYYASQAKQSGGGYAAAMPYQRGAGLGSIFKGLFRAILPVAKSVGKSVGRQALQTGTEIASEVLAGKSIKVAAEERGKAGASKLLKQAQGNMNRKNRRKQKGQGLGFRAYDALYTSYPGIQKKKKKPRKLRKDQLGLYYK